MLPRENWAGVMRSLIDGDREAFLKVSRLVRGFLAGWRAYDFQDEWPDLIQETVMAAIEGVRAGRVREPEATYNYIRAIAHNRLRRRLIVHLRKSPDAALPVEELELPGENPDAEAVATMRVALSKLSEQQSAALIAVYGNERTYEQAASDTNIPLGSLKRHLREGLARLREQFSQDL